MNFLKFLVASAAVAVIVIAFRDVESGGWLSPAGLGTIEGDEEDDEEPVLGYDGMDVDTLIDWLAQADLDGDTLRDMRNYEAGHLGREAVLLAIEERM